MSARRDGNTAVIHDFPVGQAVVQMAGGPSNVSDLDSIGGRDLARALQADHAVAYRVSLPFFRRRYYFAVFAGAEQRSTSRLMAENQRKSWFHSAFSVSAAVMFVSSMLMCTLATAYLAKSLLGIDLFDDHFFLHNLFFG